MNFRKLMSPLNRIRKPMACMPIPIRVSSKDGLLGQAMGCSVLSPWVMCTRFSSSLASLMLVPFFRIPSTMKNGLGLAEMLKYISVPSMDWNLSDRATSMMRKLRCSLSSPRRIVKPTGSASPKAFLAKDSEMMTSSGACSGRVFRCRRMFLYSK